jgi:hypothetical protein
LRRHRTLCIVEASFQGLLRTISSKVQVCERIVDGRRDCCLIARSLSRGFGACVACVLRTNDECVEAGVRIVIKLN